MWVVGWVDGVDDWVVEFVLLVEKCVVDGLWLVWLVGWLVVG